MNCCVTSVRQPCSSRALALHAMIRLSALGTFRVAAQYDLNPARSDPLTTSSS